MLNRNIETLREHLFKQLDLLSDPSAKVDMERARMVAELSQTVINSVKVEVEFAKVVKGATTLPFIESQPESVERPYSPPALAAAPAGSQRAEPEQEDGQLPRASLMQQALESGPSADHPWRGLGTRIHRSH